MTNSHPLHDALIESTRTRLAAIYKHSPALQAEFPCAEDYVAFEMKKPAKIRLIRRCREHLEDAENAKALKRAEAAGRIRILGQ
jgi:hypothetical protein